MPTINLQSKYVEDESGNKFAPITTPNAVRWSNGDNLDDKLAAKQAVIDSSNKLSASNVSGLATVATSGSYNDLSNTPTIPDAQIQSDWNQTSTTAKDYIKNKPSVFTSSANGLAPAASNANKATAESSQSKYYLCEDGKYRQLPVTAFSSGDKITPIVVLGQPSGDAPGHAIIFDLSASKYYQYLWDDNQSTYTWQEIATLEKAFAFDGYGFYEIDNGVLSQTPISVLEAGWYSDFAGFYAQSVGYAGVIMYFDEFGNSYRTVSHDEIGRWNNKSDFSGDYDDLSNKPTIPTVNNATLTIQKNGTQVATFTANASSNVTANITVPTGDLASINKDGTSSTKYLRGDGTWQTFPTIPTVPTNVSAFTNDAGYITSTDIAGKEDKMSIVVQTGYPTTLSPAINTLTKVIMQSNLTVTLPTISTNTDKVQSLVLHLSTASGYTPNLIISGSGISIQYPPDFTIESGTSYEINCMWMGNATWPVASQQIQDFGA